jgi:hypothetical protein
MKASIMLHMRETMRPPVFKDPTVQVRVNADMYIAGSLVTAGSVALMQLSDAQALRSVGRVDLII